MATAPCGQILGVEPIQLHRCFFDVEFPIDGLLTSSQFPSRLAAAANRDASSVRNEAYRRCHK
mgnify:CR=1 FL=1